MWDHRRWLQIDACQWVLVLDRQSDGVCPTYYSSERWRNPSDHEMFVVPRVYMQPLINRCSPRPSAPIRKKVLPIAEKLLQTQRKQAMCVFFFLMVPHYDSSRPIRLNKRTLHLDPPPGRSISRCAHLLTLA